MTLKSASIFTPKAFVPEMEISLADLPYIMFSYHFHRCCIHASFDKGN